MQRPMIDWRHAEDAPAADLDRRRLRAERGQRFAASPDAWTPTGPSAAIAYDGTRGDAVMRYAHAGHQGTWTMQTTAGAARKLAATWNYQGYHAYFGVKVAIERFVIRGGTEIVTETLQSASAYRCCEAPSGGFEYRGTTYFDLHAGDVYGFRMTGQNGDSDARLNGTLTLDVLDYTQLKITPKVMGTLGANGWYTSDVRVAWQITYPANYPLLSACLPRDVRTDTAGQTFSCGVRLPGDRELRESVTIKRDTTPPVVTVTGPDAINSNTLQSHGYRQRQHRRRNARPRTRPGTQPSAHRYRLGRHAAVPADLALRARRRRPGGPGRSGLDARDRDPDALQASGATPTGGQRTLQRSLGHGQPAQRRAGHDRPRCDATVEELAGTLTAIGAEEQARLLTTAAEQRAADAGADLSALDDEWFEHDLDDDLAARLSPMRPPPGRVLQRLRPFRR